MSKSERAVLVSKSREAYYNGTPLMSDDEFDALVNSLEPEDPEVVQVGADVPQTGVWPKVKHEIAMGSLSKIHTFDELKEWVAKIEQEMQRDATWVVQPTFLITHKIDGCSLEAVYEQGRLVRCVTRGNGLVGEDVTENAVQIPAIVKELPTKDNVVVRGEVVMLNSVFDKLYADEYANPRNTANGKLREKKDGGKHCQNLHFLAYTIMGLPLITEGESFKKLEQLGFQVPEFSAGDCSLMNEVYEATAAVRSSLDYDIDGMVVRVNNLKAQQALGDQHMRPKGQRAWKFQALSAKTTVERVNWNVGPTGRLCPVAVLNPVPIGGVTVTNVSLHNMAMFANLALFPGCEVSICRRNDVIPYLSANLSEPSEQKFPVPENCPICSAPLSREGDFLFCRSDDCPVKLSGAIKVWIKRFGILHWGDAMVNAVAKSSAVQSVADLYRLSVEDLAQFCSGIKMAEKCYKTLQASRKVTLEQVVGALNIQNLGPSTAADIITAGHDTVAKLMNLTVEDLMQVPNVGEITARAIYIGLQEKASLIWDLAQVLDVKKPSAGGPLSGVKICITGEVWVPRKTVQEMIVQAGGQAQSGVSKDTTYLVCDQDAGSSKSQKAAKYGVKVISSAALKSLLETGKLPE